MQIAGLRTNGAAERALTTNGRHLPLRELAMTTDAYENFLDMSRRKDKGWARMPKPLVIWKAAAGARHQLLDAFETTPPPFLWHLLGAK